MFAIIQVGSLQYKVSEGDCIETQLLNGKKGEAVHLDKVLLVSNGTDVRIGQPYLKEAVVNAEVLNRHLGPKAVSFKYRRRKTSSWKRGHRQKLTSLRINKIQVP